jgi:peptidoglycan/LPS O-acetylase OafA/YrhL
MTAGRTPFTVGIPVLNEEAILVPNTERLLHYLDGLGRDYEVLIGSNGSTDSTTALGVDLSRRFKNVTFFHLPEKGVGFAFKEFVRRARHPFLVSVDMDLSVDLEFIATAVELLETHDIVVGSKKMGNQNRTLFRRLGSDSFLQATRLLLGQTFTGGYFLIALAQLALVAPWLCRLAAVRPRLFGGAAAGLLAVTLCAEQIAASGGETGWAIIINGGFSAALSTGLVWAPFFMAGILGGFDPAGLRERLVRRAGWLVVLAAIALPLSVLEFRMVLEVTGSAGLAATFLKPSSIAVAIAISGLVLVVPAGPLAARAVRSLAPASFAIYLVHGGVIEAMARLMPGAGRSMADAWIGVIGTILAGLALPLLLHRFAARRFAQPLNLLLFGRADARRAPSRRADSDGAGRHAAPDGGAPREAAPSWNAKAS